MTNSTQSLQINVTGAWRNVVMLTKEQMIEIAPHLSAMAKIVGSKHTWRVVDTTVDSVIGYLEGPDWVEWRAPTR